MNDKEFNTQRKRVLKIWNKWRNPLGMGWWKVTIDFSRESKPDGDATYAPTDVSGKWSCVFDVRCDYMYKTAGVTAYLPIVKNISDEKLERYFLHELMHIHLSAMRHKDRSAEEELVATTLADVVLWVTEEKKLFKGRKISKKK